MVLWSAGDARLFLDGQAAFSPPDAPRRISVGEHRIRLESPGQEPLETQVRIDPFTPALFHGELDPEAGLNLVTVGAVCASCTEAVSPLRLSFEPAEVASHTLLISAAQALRKNDWQRAATFLRGVPVKARRPSALFHRLAAAAFNDAVQPQKARAELEALPAAERKELEKLLRALDALRQAELKRQAEVVVLRWNKVTERFQALIQRFGTKATGPTQSASRRLGELSSAFESALGAKDLLQQERLLRAAEDALSSVATQIRAAHPTDCPFQAEVVGTLVQ